MSDVLIVKNVLIKLQLLTSKHAPMKDGHITTVLVHSMLKEQQGPTDATPQSKIIRMYYEQYDPLGADIKNKFRSRSFYDSKKKGAFHEKQTSKSKGLNKLVERNQSSASQPKRIDLQFLNTKPVRNRKTTSKPSIDSKQYHSLMLDSTEDYMKRVEKGKRKRWEKFEKVKNFGINIQAIKAKPDLSGLFVSQNCFRRKRSPTINNYSTITKDSEKNLSLQMHNNLSTCDTVTKQYSKTFSGLQHPQLSTKSRGAAKKLSLKSGKKHEENKIALKLHRMFSTFHVILASFGVRIRKDTDIPTFENRLKKGQKKYSYYVGKGNNKNLIISILKKRWWWTESEDMANANFVWTQTKVPSILQKEASMAYSGMQDPQTHLYARMDNKQDLSFEEEETSQNIYSLFHSKHSSRFHHKVSWKQERLLLRQMKVPQVTHNHYQANYMLGNKKALYYNMKEYKAYKNQDLFQFIPLTYHVENTSCRSFKIFQKQFKQLKKSLWIVKPGENSNRGQGIFVSDSFEAIKSKIDKNKKHTFIIQRYVKNNLTFQRRKFDIRTYVLMASIGGVKKFYWYSEGYLRTSSQIYDLSDLDDPFVHLTNDAIQAHGDNYGKFEKGNKVTYNEFQRYLDLTYPGQKYSVPGLVNKMKQIAKEVVTATYFKLDPSRKLCGFELFGLDFLIDSNFKPWLLEVNTNPCLQLSSPVLQRLIPRMIENLFRIVVDPLFQPAQKQMPRSLACYIPDSVIDNNRFQLIFDCLFDRDEQWQQHSYSLNANTHQVYEDENEEFDDDGQIIKIED